MDIKAKLKVLVGVGVAAALLVLAYEVFYWFTHVYESNARVQTDFTYLSPQIDGKIEKIHVAEGSRVEKGRLLITLVHDDIRLNIDSLQTDLALERARRASLMAERDAFEAELRSKLATQREKIRALEVELASTVERLQLARKDLSRVNVLVDKKISPESRLIVEQDRTLVLEGKADSLRGAIGVARKELEQLTATERQIDVINNRISVSFQKQNKILDEIRRQELLLSYRHIRSPIDGVVGRILHYEGEYLEDGVNILMVHDPRLYWIEADVDEDQIRHVRVGQEVLIDLDAYPFEDFHGRVRHIGTVTTNGAGNGAGGGRSLGGSVERVPVRISIDNPPPNLTPGMQADVNIRIYEWIRLWRTPERE